MAVDLKLGIGHAFEITHSIYKILKPDEFIFISDASCFFLLIFTREDISEYAEALSERKPIETLLRHIDLEGLGQIVTQLHLVKV